MKLNKRGGRHPVNPFLTMYSLNIAFSHFLYEFTVARTELWQSDRFHLHCYEYFVHHVICCYIEVWTTWMVSVFVFASNSNTV